MADTTIDNYRVLSQLTSGSSRRVYLVEHAAFPNRTLALKLMQNAPFTTQEQREQFLREAQTFKILQHPHILPVIDAGIHDNLPYIVSAYAAQGSLRRYLQRQGGKPLPTEEALTILAQVGQALKYAHRHNVIHRNLKPENILFNSRNEVLLTDFGLTSTQAASTSKTEASSYMAPEQFLGMTNRQTDQYALGCIAYELFTGQRVFTGGDAVSLMQKHIAAQPIPPTQHNPAISPSLEQAILKALARQNHERHIDIDTFLVALGAPLQTTSPQLGIIPIPKVIPSADLSAQPQFSSPTNIETSLETTLPRTPVVMPSPQPGLQEITLPRTPVTALQAIEQHQAIPGSPSLELANAVLADEATLPQSTPMRAATVAAAMGTTSQIPSQLANLLTTIVPLPRRQQPFVFTRPIILRLALIALVLLGSGLLFFALHQTSPNTNLPQHGNGSSIAQGNTTATSTTGHLGTSPTASGNASSTATSGQIPPPTFGVSPTVSTQPGSSPTPGITATPDPQADGTPSDPDATPTPNNPSGNNPPPAPTPTPNNPPGNNPPPAPTPTPNPQPGGNPPPPGTPNLVVSAGITTSSSPIWNQQFSASYTVSNIGNGTFYLRMLIIAMRGPHNENVDLGVDYNGTPIQPGQSRTISLSTANLAGKCTTCGAGTYTIFASVLLPNGQFWPNPPTINGAQSQEQINVSAIYGTFVAATQDVPGTAIAPIPFGATVYISAPATPAATYTPTSDGNCRFSPVLTDPNGMRYNFGRPCGPKIDPAANDPNAYIGQLLYGIQCNGASTPTWYAAGTNTQFTLDPTIYCGGNTSQPALLSLLYNDTPGGYGNNTGGYNVTIGITP